MGFNATDYVEPLDYDFNPMFNYSGTITEPSDEAIAKFLRKWYRLIAEVRKTAAAAVVEANTAAAAVSKAVEERNEQDPTEPITFDQAVETMSAIDWNAVENEQDQSNQTKLARDVLKQMCLLVEDLAAGSIRSDKLMQVPMRVRGVFFGWLVSELTEQGKGIGGSSSGSAAKTS